MLTGGGGGGRGREGEGEGEGEGSTVMHRVSWWGRGGECSDSHNGIKRLAPFIYHVTSMILPACYKNAACCHPKEQYSGIVCMSTTCLPAHEESCSVCVNAGKLLLVDIHMSLSDGGWFPA